MQAGIEIGEKNMKKAKERFTKNLLSDNIRLDCRLEMTVIKLK